MFVSPIRDPLITGNKDYHQITDDIAKNTEGRPQPLWLLGVGIASLALLFGLVMIGLTVWYGIGTWNLNRTIGWGWDITNFVWWVGIGHAGTLISAILLLFRQKWRTGVNRSAEAMTIFAVACAGLFPLIHMGRPWLAFFIFPYPNTRAVWPNFDSPLLWDVFAISTYLTVSLLFWYIGLIPDLATLRDRAKSKLRKSIYGTLSFGWQGTSKQWQRFEAISLVLAGLATPLVLSVHSVVSFDFATSIVPGWHSTVFPPYFVAGAIFSGFAMVLTLMLIARQVMNLKDYITIGHIESMNKVIILTGGIVAVAYGAEFFTAWYTGSPYETDVYMSAGAATGPYWWAFWALILCNITVPQLLWIPKVRRNVVMTFIISIVINIGMWFERFCIIVMDLSRDYLPSSWTYYVPTLAEIGIFVGTLGLFFTLFLLFARVFPVVAIAEVKSIWRTSSNQAIEKMKQKEKQEVQEVTSGE